MKKLKVIIILLITIFITGCKNTETPINKTIEEQISEMPLINLNSPANSTEESPFYIDSVTENVDPAITYTNKNKTTSTEIELPMTGGDDETETSSEKDLANINLSRTIALQLKYNEKLGEKPEKIVLNYVKVTTKPKKGKVKLHAIKEGDYYTYIEKMRDNEITSSVEYEKDLAENKLEDGSQHIRFSVTIDEIVKSTTDELMEKDYLEILKSNNITKDDLKYKVEFAITIYTKNDVYASKLEFESMDLDIYQKQTDNISHSTNPIYFEKIKME